MSVAAPGRIVVRAGGEVPLFSDGQLRSPALYVPFVAGGGAESRSAPGADGPREAPAVVGGWGDSASRPAPAVDEQVGFAWSEQLTLALGDWMHADPAGRAAADDSAIAAAVAQLDLAAYPEDARRRDLAAVQARQAAAQACADDPRCYECDENRTRLLAEAHFLALVVAALLVVGPVPAVADASRGPEAPASCGGAGVEPPPGLEAGSGDPYLESPWKSRPRARGRNMVPPWTAADTPAGSPASGGEVRGGNVPGPSVAADPWWARNGPDAGPWVSGAESIAEPRRGTWGRNHRMPGEERCGQSAVLGTCEEGHTHGRVLYCGREWCDDCRDQSHDHRKATCYERLTRFKTIGYLVITLPPEARGPFRGPTTEDVKRAHERLRNSVQPVLQAHGYGLALWRFHEFGDPPSDGTAPEFNPHLNVLCEGGPERGARLPKPELAAMKSEIRERLAAAFPEHAARMLQAVIRYEPKPTRRAMLHAIKYVTRPTFLDWRWDAKLARNLWGVHLSGWWGSAAAWAARPKLWEVGEGEGDLDPALFEYANCRCPFDHTPITWYPGSVSLRELAQRGYVEYKPGYWTIPKPRDTS